ncbi:putative gustatory receptor 2a isoform X2 [Anopheles gambiae]|nr:putative gustatory receptor 2a isoform X2 [Anopheles gambiae]
MLTSNEDALKAFECFTLVVKCLGLYPPVTCSRKRTLLGYKLCNLLAIAFSATFYGFLLLFHSLDLETIKLGSGSLITSRMHDVYFVSRYLTVLAVLLHSYINQNSVDQLFGSLNEVSSALVTLNTNHASEGSIGYFGTQRFARHLRWLMLVYPLMFVSMTGFVERWLPRFGVQVHAFNLVRFLYFYSYVHLWAQAILTLFLVLSRYIALNNLFRMYFPTSPSAVGNPSEFAICSEKEQINVLKQIKILHDKLNDVVELVNYCFSVQITFCVGLCFVIGVVCSFGLFRAFIYRNELFYMGVLNFIWYMYYLFFVLFFIAVGSKITREGKRIGILVHKAINCSSSSAVINELNLFSQQLLHRSPVITCGLFVYDWTLWYTMIGATATYLIILIQFDVSFPNLVNVNATAVYRGST